jgi:ketosteroid isomerase-like protein
VALGRDLGLVPVPRIRCRRLSGTRRNPHSGNGSAAFEEIRVELVELIKVEDERLIAENVAYLRGRDGIEVQARSAWLITTRDGEQTSLTMYQTKQEALEAAGPRD